MRRFTYTSGLLAVAIAGYGDVAQGQQEQAQQPQAQQQAQQGQQQAGPIGESEALQLVGRQLKSSDGEDIGEIDEIVRSRADGQLHAVGDVGGFFGIGDRSVAIPLERAEIDQEGNLVMEMSREQLEQMQEFDPEQYQAVAAQPGGGEMPAFEEVDTDSDGWISRTELASVEGLDFSEADENQDGFVSREEYRQATQR